MPVSATLGTHASRASSPRGSDGTRTGGACSRAARLNCTARGVWMLGGGKSMSGQGLHRYEGYVAALGGETEPYEGYMQALRYGMSPHGGFALGLERWVAQLVGARNVLRETTTRRSGASTRLSCMATTSASSDRRRRRGGCSRRLRGFAGRIVAASNDPYATEDPAHLAYQERNPARGRMPGQLRLRVRYRDLVGPWFEYLIVSPAEMADIVDGPGWQICRPRPRRGLLLCRGARLASIRVESRMRTDRRSSVAQADAATASSLGRSPTS